MSTNLPMFLVIDENSIGKGVRGRGGHVGGGCEWPCQVVPVVRDFFWGFRISNCLENPTGLAIKVY